MLFSSPYCLIPDSQIIIFLLTNLILRQFKSISPWLLFELSYHRVWHLFMSLILCIILLGSFDLHNFVDKLLSVNDPFPHNSYLREPFTLCLPGTSTLADLIQHHIHGYLLYKKYLSQAYHQLDYHLLGIHTTINSISFNLWSTVAVTSMFQDLGYSCTNYIIDDFAGADSPDNAFHAFSTLGQLIDNLGLASTPQKDCTPSPSMVFLSMHPI